MINLDDVLLKLTEIKATLVDAYDAGRDCALNGVDIENCHYKFFTSRQLRHAWECGLHGRQA